MLPVRSCTVTGTGGYELVAGERRYASSLELGLPDIPVRFAQDLSPTELAIIELEENIKRSDLHWRDLVSAVQSIHSLYVELDQDWTMIETGNACSLTQGIVSMYLAVAAGFGDPHVDKAGTVREAYNLLVRRQRRAQGDALQELLDTPTPVPVREALQTLLDNPAPINREAVDSMLDEIESRMEEPEDTFGDLEQAPLPLMARQAVANVSISKSGPITFPAEPSLPGFNLAPIQCEDFTQWAATYSGRKFNLIHCDFPYGINLFSSNGVRTGAQRSQMGQDEGEVYDDSEDVFQTLLDTLCTQLNRLMSVSGHLMFWYSNKREIESRIISTFARLAPDVEFNTFPLIWLKSDNAGIASKPTREPRHIYETCLVASRGKRQIIKLVSDAYSAPTDKSIHQSAKPEPMLRHFMSMFVDENTLMLDPTCGSGTALRAADSLGAKYVLGLERDSRMVELASAAFTKARLLRKVTRES